MEHINVSLQRIRASNLRKAIIKLLKDEEVFRGEPIWAPFTIQMYCRHRLYTPIDEGRSTISSVFQILFYKD